MATVRAVALWFSMAVLLGACAESGDADLTSGPGVTQATTTSTMAETTTTTALSLPTTAPRPTDPPAPTSTEPTVPPTTLPPTTTTTRPAVLAGPVSYSITGGIAGISDRLVISADGGADFQSGTKNVNFTVARAQLMRLATALTDADFPSLASVYGFAVPDGFEYRVSYVGKTVLIFGSAEPSRLRPALAILAQEMERARAL